MSPGVRAMVWSALAFSGMTLLVKVAGRELPSQEIVLARAVISLVLSWAIVRRAGVSLWGERRPLLLLRGLVGFVGLSCFYFAVTRLGLAEATLLHYTNPVFTALFAALFLRESASLRIVGSIAVSLAGVALMARPEFLFGGELGGLDPLGVRVGLFGAVCSAAAYTIVRALAKTEHPHVIVFYFPLVAVPLSIPTSLPDAVWPSPLTWLVLLGVGITTQLGQVFLTKGLQHERAAKATVVGYLQIVFAALWGALFFGDLPDAWTVAGAALIVGGAYWATRAGRSRVTRPRPGAA